MKFTEEKLEKAFKEQYPPPDIIRNFIYIPDKSKKEEKIVCRYPQYYAARTLFDNNQKSPKARRRWVLNQ